MSEASLWALGWTLGLFFCQRVFFSFASQQKKRTDMDTNNIYYVKIKKIFQNLLKKNFPDVKFFRQTSSEVIVILQLNIYADIIADKLFNFLYKNWSFLSVKNIKK